MENQRGELAKPGAGQFKFEVTKVRENLWKQGQTK